MSSCVNQMSIPKAGQIDVPDAPDIHYSELVLQILSNVSSQIAVLDTELAAASASDKIGSQSHRRSPYRTASYYTIIHRRKSAGTI